MGNFVMNLTTADFEFLNDVKFWQIVATQFTPLKLCCMVVEIFAMYVDYLEVKI